MAGNEENGGLPTFDDCPWNHKAFTPYDIAADFDVKKGYMLSYNFNQKKEIGVKEIHIGDRILVEAVV